MIRTYVTPLYFLMAAAAIGQPQVPKFEVASVKLVERQSGGGRTTVSGNDIAFRNTTMKNVLGITFEVASGEQISGPSWINTERYDIQAKAPDGTARELIPEMLKNLLVERFGLKLRLETKDFPAYVLLLNRTGPALRPGTGGIRNNIAVSGDKREAKNTDMPNLVRFISLMLRAPVLDQTSLSGSYDFAFPFSREERGADSTDPSIFTIVGELGLKLESHKEPLQVVVVESGNPIPTEN